ncbi:MAG: CRTAC1 family protein [Phycisphaerales bacterium]|nr:CRTAC1 family protein [Phycisphaerales bacterium]
MLHATSAVSAALAALVAVPALAGVDPIFSNQTSAAGVAVSHATSGFQLTEYAGGGAIGDFNNDGWQDLYFISGGGNGHADYLFINNGDGTFTDQAAAWGLTELHKGKGACVGDYNGDGWLDLFVTSAGPVGQGSAPGHNKLYQNNGDGTFTNVAATAGVAFADPSFPSSWGACFGDYDLDGDLDLYVGGFNVSTPSNNGNHLFQNNGDGTFTDVTASIGLFAGIGPIANFGEAFVDMNGDRSPELLLSGDFKGAGTFIGSRYLRNDGDGTFSDGTAAGHLGQEENGMGQTRGDFNNDLKWDWYVTSIYHPPFGWTGNKLYLNLGGQSFVERAALADCDDGGYGWGTVAVDVNHDTWTDIGETNGDNSSSGLFFNEQSYLWINDGGGTSFTEMAVAAGMIHNGKGRCMIHFDYDNDGDQDILIFTNKGPLSLFRNDLPAGPDTNWLRVFLDTNGDPAKAPNGFGARVVVVAGDTQMLRVIDGQTTFLGNSEISAHFGLGAATTIDELRVEWPDGTETVMNNVAANQVLTISSLPAACPADLDGNGTVDGADLGALLAAWGGRGAGDLDGSGTVDGADLGALLAAWGDCN